MNGPGSLQAWTIRGRLCKNRSAICSPVRLRFDRQKAAHAEPLDRVSLGTVVADPVVLHEHDSAPLTGEMQPFGIGYILVVGDAVVLGESDEAEPGYSKQPGNLDPAQTPVEE